MGRQKKLLAQGYYNGINFSMVNKELTKVRNSLNPSEEGFWDVPIFGHKLNVLPFLLCSSGWFDDTVQGLILGMSGELFLDYGELSEGEFRSKVKDLVDLDAYLALNLEQGLLYISDLLLYSMLSKDKKYFAVVCFNGISTLVQKVIMESGYVDYKYHDDTLANSQAFSCYVCMYWLLRKSPLIYSMLTRYNRIVDWETKFNSLLPRGSYLRQYVEGEITGATLLAEMIKVRFKDKTSIWMREYLSNLSEGAYSGEDVPSIYLPALKKAQDYNLTRLYRALHIDFGYALFASGVFDSLKHKCSNLELELEAQQSKVSKEIDKRKSISTELSGLETKVASLESENSNLRGSLRKLQSQDDRIRTLKDELAMQESVNNTLIEQINFMRVRLKAASKSIKIDSPLSPEIVVEPENVVCEKSIAERLSEVQDKNIIIVGANSDNRFISALETFGFKSVIPFNEGTKYKHGKYVVVIITQLVSHKAVRRCLADTRYTDIVYYNSKGTSGFGEFLLEELTNA